MVKKKIEILTQEKKRELTSGKEEHRRVNKELQGMSGKYSGR